MKFRDFSGQYLDNPDAGMRAALNHAVLTAGLSAKQIAAELDLSPSELSRMISMTPSEDPNSRRSMPAGKIVELTKLTNNWSPLATFLGYMGFDPERLHEIRKDKGAIQRDLVLALEKVNALAVQLGMFGVQAVPLKRRRVLGT